VKYESYYDDADLDMLDLVATPELIEEQKPELGVELHVGSNVFRTTNGVVKLQGKEQIALEVRPLTMDFYDEEGRRIGHLRRNTLSGSSASRFAVAISSTHSPSVNEPWTVTVSDLATGDTVVEAYLFQKQKIRIATGRFYTHKGELVTVSPHFFRVGTGPTRFGDVADSRGGEAVIG
jgi:hypothetical protein